MISRSEGISDLLFAVGRPPIVEEYGVLEEFPLETATGVLDLTQIEQIAASIQTFGFVSPLIKSQRAMCSRREIARRAFDSEHPSSRATRGAPVHGAVIR